MFYLVLKPLKFILKRKTLDVFYKSLVRSYLDYADIIWDGCTETDSDLEKLQIDAARLVTGAIKGTSRESLLKETAWVRLRSRRSNHKLFMMFKMFK